MDMPKLLDGRLKIRHLLLVDALNRRGTVIGAAAELHISQPVATRSLHDIERILGVALFERDPRGVTPTVFGTAFATHSRGIIAQLTETGRHLVELANADRGTVVVGSHLAGSSMLLPGAIAHLKAHHPLLMVAVREGTPEQLVTDLEAGAIDIIIGRLTAPTDHTFIRETLYTESVQLIARANHPLVAGKNVHLSDTVDYPWILPSIETSLRTELEEFFADNKLALPENRVETTSYLTIRQLVIETDMIAVLPDLLARDDARLTSLPISLGRIGHNVGTTRTSSRIATPTAQAFIASLTAVAHEMTLRRCNDRGSANPVNHHSVPATYR